MSTHTTRTRHRASPLRVLQRLGWRFKQPGSPVPRLAVEVMDAQLATQEADLTAAHAEAVQIADGLTETRRAMSAALTDKVTPGIITEPEARDIARTMIDTSITASAHVERLGAMV